MSVSDVDRDVAKMTRDHIDEHWDASNADKPQYIELRTEDSEGNTRKAVRRHNEYILFAEESERNMEYSDVAWNSRNITQTCYAEISTAESRQRREDLFAEVERIAVESRTGLAAIGTPGGWDNLRINASFIDDENFGWWVAEVTFEYTKKKEMI